MARPQVGHSTNGAGAPVTGIIVVTTTSKEMQLGLPDHRKRDHVLSHRLTSRQEGVTKSPVLPCGPHFHWTRSSPGVVNRLSVGISKRKYVCHKS